MVAVPDDAGGGDCVRPVVVPGDDLRRPGDLLLRRHSQGPPRSSLRRLRRPHQGILQVGGMETKLVGRFESLVPFAGLRKLEFICDFYHT